MRRLCFAVCLAALLALGLGSQGVQCDDCYAHYYAATDEADSMYTWRIYVAYTEHAAGNTTEAQYADALWTAGWIKSNEYQQASDDLLACTM